MRTSTNTSSTSSAAIVRVDPETRGIKRWPLPEARGYVNLNTPTFDRRGRIWFTGQNGVYGRLDPTTGDMQVWDAPRGRGPYGIATTPDGAVYYASLAGSHIARVDLDTGAATIIEPPTKNQGARRVWSDSRGRIWISEWNSGNVSRFDPGSGSWRTWKLPGDRPRAYAVYVDDRDMVWVSDWGANVRQILGRPGEVWAPESGTNRLVVYRVK